MRGININGEVAIMCGRLAPKSEGKNMSCLWCGAKFKQQNKPKLYCSEGCFKADDADHRQEHTDFRSLINKAEFERAHRQDQDRFIIRRIPLSNG